jgi:hypothetical protein
MLVLIQDLELIPKWVKQKERYYEVYGAIARYYDAGKKIPIEWIEEYNELVGRYY